jgi:hypothetical protein
MISPRGLVPGPVLTTSTCTWSSPIVLASASTVDEYKVVPTGRIVQIGATPTIADTGVSALAAS